MTISLTHVMLVLTLGVSVTRVTGNIRGDLGEGWHYLAKGVGLRDLQPTRSPRQIIGSRSDDFCANSLFIDH